MLKGLYSTDYEEAVDFETLRKERVQRTKSAMAKFGVDALLLAKQANVKYVTAARSLDVMGRGAGLPGAVMTSSAPAPYIWSQHPDDVPSFIPRDHIFPFMWHPVKHVGLIVNVLGPAAKGKIAVDAVAPYFITTLNAMVPNANLVDGNQVMYEARKTKTRDEIECIRLAHRIVGTGMDEALQRLRPGVRDIDLHGAFLEAVSRWGVTFPVGAGVYASQPKFRAASSWSPDGSPPYRQLPRDDIFGEGEMVTIETGAFYLGYVGLFSRTWFCTWNAKPRPQQKDLHRRWREVFDRMAEKCRPGATIADVRLAAGDVDAPRYVIHGVGLGIEPPVGARGLGPDQERSWVLEPGMVIAVSPYVWQEGVGGYRAGETLLITERGHQVLSPFPYGPLAE